MTKKLLIAVDLSDEALQVMRAGRELAASLGAEYHVATFIEKPVTGIGELTTATPLFNIVQLKQECFPILSKYADELGIDHQHLSIEVGHPSDAIVAKANEDEVDILVIGSHGRRGLQLLLGSTANAVLHKASCDVYAVRIQ